MQPHIKLSTVLVLPNRGRTRVIDHGYTVKSYVNIGERERISLGSLRPPPIRQSRKLWVGGSVLIGVLEYGGFLDLSLAEESLVLSLLIVLGFLAIVAPRLRDWWRRRREKHDIEDRQRRDRRKNREQF